MFIVKRDKCYTLFENSIISFQNKMRRLTPILCVEATSATDARSKFAVYLSTEAKNEYCARHPNVPIQPWKDQLFRDQARHNLSSTRGCLVLSAGQLRRQLLDEVGRGWTYA